MVSSKLHSVWPAARFVGQGNGAWRVSRQNIPGGHVIHWAMPALSAYDPSGHLSHETW
jgi:hypothetical protein